MNGMDEWQQKANEQMQRIPWGINTIGSLYHPDCSAGLPDGRWVAAVCEPCPPSLVERFRAAWWVFTGRAHAFVWPRAGDLEAIWTRDNPTLRSSPRPFVPQGKQAPRS